MFRNYLIIAWRNITNRKFYTFLNITGLALAISCCTFIYLYTAYNLSFDSYHKNSDRIFRLVHQLHFDKTEYNASASYAEYKYLKTSVSQVQKAAFMLRNQSLTVDVGNNLRFQEDNNVSFTDADWFGIFTYKWLKGNPVQLNQPGNVVLRENIARKYFGNIDPMGKTVNFDGHPVKVSGIIADAPYNTDLKYNIIVSFSSLNTLIPAYAGDKGFLKDWGDVGTKYTGFVVLKNAADEIAVKRQLDEMDRKLFKADAKIFDFGLLPLSENHFDTRYAGSVQRSLLLNLIIVGILIISIAVINYINIVVAQQTRRGVEIGTRKVLGGSTLQIFMQFIVESMVTTSIAVVLSLFMVMALLPIANNWFFTDAPVYILSYTNLALYLSALLMAITIASGAYPAWLLSRISIARALKNNVLNLPAGIGRKALVVFQNVVTQGLIVCAIIIVLQVNFLKNTDIGFNRSMVATVPIGKVAPSQKYQLKEAFKQMPGVQSFSFCLNSPASTSQRGATVKFGTYKWEDWPARFALGDSAYCRTFGLQIIAGRNIHSKQAEPEFLVNQTMADMLAAEHKEDVIGKKLSAGDSKGVIVGIVKDFNVNSLADKIEPSVMLEDTTLQFNVGLKLSSKNLNATLTSLQKVYKDVLPDKVFSYQFVDEQIANLYKRENIQQKLILVGALVAITISSLGLLGLVSLMALQRTKEIGIRKVLGASVSQICIMLSGDFIRLILLAFVLASVIGVWAMQKWLQNFAYHIHIQWWMFALAGLSALLIALLSVGYQAIRAAAANPVNSLRSE